MRLLDASPWRDDGLLYRDEAEVSEIADAIYALLAARASSFGMERARKLPAVVRGVALLCGTGAALSPLAYRGGAVMPQQPRIVRQPNPFTTRYQHVYQSLRGLVEDGYCYWRLTIPPGETYPVSAVCLANEEVSVQWDDKRWQRVYWWRGQKQPAGTIKHVMIGARAGELNGRGPLRESLDYLAPVAAAEDYAQLFFTSGGIPETVIKHPGSGNATTAADLKRAWMESRQGPEPAVLFGGIDVQFPGVNPENAQMHESRAQGYKVVASLLGIPPALMMVETSGATITYTNPEGAMDDLVKSTLIPQYLQPLEQAWSDLTPAPQVVRYHAGELERADIVKRLAIYAQMRELGVITDEGIMAAEGWAAAGAGDELAHAFDPVPAQDTKTPEGIPS